LHCLYQGKALSRLTEEKGASRTIRSHLSSASIVTTRNELIQGTNELLQLSMMPSEYLLSLALSGADTANLELLIRFEIAQNVPLDSSIEISALSAKVNLPEDDLKRALRFAISNVGGSSGHTVMAIAPLAPYAHFIVQDNDLSALELRKYRSQQLLDDETRSRITFQKHNFFKDQPVRAECYILRYVLHDWNDQDSIAIFKALLIALEPGSRVFISEGLMSDPPAQRLNTLANDRIEDQFIMAAHNAHKRTLNDYVQRFKQVSSRFTLVGVTSGAKDGAFQSLLEFQFN
ncbi:hypothetical protein N7540_005922, partial [Penicillium herquei]